MTRKSPGESVVVRPSSIHGMGAFSTTRLPARRKIGEIGGRLLRLPGARRAVEKADRIYLIELDDRHALECSDGGPLSRLNHSCQPNCYLRIFRHRVEVYSLRTIPRDTELTVDYGITPHRNGMVCRCGHPECRGKL